MKYKRLFGSLNMAYDDKHMAVYLIGSDVFKYGLTSENKAQIELCEQRGDDITHDIFISQIPSAGKLTLESLANVVLYRSYTE